MILIIDDDIAVKTSLQLLLETEGYKTTTADGASEALALLKSNGKDNFAKWNKYLQAAEIAFHRPGISTSLYHD